MYSKVIHLHIYTYIYIYVYILFHYGLLQDIEHSGNSFFIWQGLEFFSPQSVIHQWSFKLLSSLQSFTNSWIWKVFNVWLLSSGCQRLLFYCLCKEYSETIVLCIISVFTLSLLPLLFAKQMFSTPSLQWEGNIRKSSKILKQKLPNSTFFLLLCQIGKKYCQIPAKCKHVCLPNIPPALGSLWLKP